MMLPPDVVTARDVFLAVAELWIGRWYTWGGEGPGGFDCSGLVQECASAAGLAPPGSRYTSRTFRSELWGGLNDVPLHEARPGCVVFFSNGRRDRVINHVELLWRRSAAREYFTIGASGGGPKVTTLEAAMKANAFVKVRPLNRRIPAVVSIVDPFPDLA